MLVDPVKFFKCLADDTRLKSLLLLIGNKELCVCELVIALDKIQPMISRHLAQLRQADILVDRRQGQWVYYRLNPELPAWMQQVLQHTLASDTELLAEETRRLDYMRNKQHQEGNLACVK